MADPRLDNARHAFIDLLTIALFAVICGADSWVAVVAYARAKEPWRKIFLTRQSCGWDNAYLLKVVAG